MTADSSAATITHSGEDAVNSPSSRKTLPSPWAQVVRGGIDLDSNSPSPSPGFTQRDLVFSDPPTVVEAPAIAIANTQPEASDGGGNCNAGGVMKSPWNKPSANGVVEVTASPVMNAASWPALSESTKPGVKSSSDSSVSSSKPTTDGSAAASQAPLISQPPPKHVKPTSNSHSNQNYLRQRSFKRGGSASGASSGYTRPPPLPPVPPVAPVPPPFPVFHMHNNLVPGVPQSPHFKPNTWSPRPADHSLNRRRNNFNPRPLNNGHGARRENLAPRPHIPHQMSPPPLPPYPGFIRPVFVPFRPYGAPMVYDAGASYAYFPTPPAQVPYRGGAPVVLHGASTSSMPVTSMDSSLHEKIRKQIEYYFSDDNLARDNYLRSHMDDEGWVPITLVAGFRRVQDMTKDIQVLLSSLQDSSTVEVQGDKIRRRANWRRWVHTPRRVTGNPPVVETSLQQLTLEDRSTNEGNRVLANGVVSN